MNVDQRCLNYIRTHGLIPRDSRVLVGVSGGPDSMALLHMLATWQRLLGITALGAVVVDHGLRAESAAEADMVEAFCKEKEIPCLRYTAPAGWQQSYPGSSTEEAARHLRYGFFEKAGQAFSADRIALGHHGDDRAETILMDMISGCGRSGLSGIPRERLPYVRPLLMLTKAELEAYCREEDIPYCMDASNRDTIYKRNRIRHELIPYLAENYNPSVTRALNRTAEILTLEEEFLSAVTEKAYKDCVKVIYDGIELMLEPFLALHPAIGRRLLLKVGEEVTGRSLSFERVEALRALTAAQSGRQVELPGGFVAHRSYDRIVFRRRQEAFEPVLLQVPMDVSRGRLRLRTDRVENIPTEAQNEENVFLSFTDCDIINKSIACRKWQAADTICRPGDNAPKSLHDLFQKHRVPRHRREEILVLAEGSRVLWVPELFWYADGFLKQKGPAIGLMITLDTEE